MDDSEFNISSESLIRNAIQEMIKNNILKPGDKLPSENTLADEFKVKRIVARNALIQMEKMGLIDSRQGIGRFVQTKLPIIELDMTGRRSFSEKMKEQDVPYESKVIFAGYANDQEQNKYRKLLGCDDSIFIFKVTRLRIVHEVPYAIHISYIREDMVPKISHETDQLQSIYSYYRKNGYLNLKSNHAMIQTVFPTINEQRTLECRELVPLIVYESETMDEDSGYTLEKTKILYRSDLFKQSISSI